VGRYAKWYIVLWIQVGMELGVSDGPILHMLQNKARKL
jgi:hypothetical protein